MVCVQPMLHSEYEHPHSTGYVLDIHQEELEWISKQLMVLRTLNLTMINNPI